MHVTGNIPLSPREEITMLHVTLGWESRDIHVPGLIPFRHVKHQSINRVLFSVTRLETKL